MVWNVSFGGTFLLKKWSWIFFFSSNANTAFSVPFKKNTLKNGCIWGKNWAKTYIPHLKIWHLKSVVFNHFKSSACKFTLNIVEFDHHGNEGCESKNKNSSEIGEQNPTTCPRQNKKKNGIIIALIIKINDTRSNPALKT